ncbi:type Z 30S ribosomal protein S14 [Deferribacterales bacterium RsTz2092]|nr:30S ribosomal protein S14 type Z [Deferribacterales bacterium]
MATTAKYNSAFKKKKFKVRVKNRCPLCGRPRAYIRRFNMCRMCFRKLALAGEIPGVRKSSW